MVAKDDYLPAFTLAQIKYCPCNSCPGQKRIFHSHGLSAKYGSTRVFFIAGLVGAGLSVNSWLPVPSSQLGWLLFSAMLLSSGFYLQICAVRQGELSFIAPFFYIGIPVAAFWGYFVWGDVIGTRMLAGIGLIIGSGLFIMVRQAKREQKPDPLESI